MNNRPLTSPQPPLRSSALAALLGAACFLSSCTAPVPQGAPRNEGAAVTAGLSRHSSDTAHAAPERPGLGTMYGEKKESKIHSTYFVRARKTRPLCTGKVFYNDHDGAKAMLLDRRFDRGWGPVTLGDGRVSFGLQDSSGRYLQSYRSGKDRIFVGKRGQRYTIVAKNLTSSRLELVFSVDGLDVIDGRPASFSKRGYVLDPGQLIRVKGFRQSEEHVAAFRFSSVGESYAERKHGSSRNVGVIGLAAFHEQGTRPQPWSHTDMRRRLDADPFPRSSPFATPPPTND